MKQLPIFSLSLFIMGCVAQQQFKEFEGDYGIKLYIPYEVGDIVLEDMRENPMAAPAFVTDKGKLVVLAPTYISTMSLLWTAQIGKY